METKKTSARYSPEVRARAVRMVLDEPRLELSRPGEGAAASRVAGEANNQ